MTAQTDAPSVLAFLAVLAVWLSALSAPLFTNLVDAEPRRFRSIDGLRGLLAISVFGHHFVITAQWQQAGMWGLVNNPAWNAMGHAPVSLFFMITGFLFFGKIENRKQRLNFITFIRGRILRIYPVYLVCVLASIVIALGLHDHPVLLLEAGKSIALWMIFCLGNLLGMSNAGLMVAYAPWSLRYEWCFYLALPALAWSWRRFGYHPAFVATLCILSLALVHWPVRIGSSNYQLDSRFIAPFFLGGAALLLTRSARLCRVFEGAVGSSVFVTALIAICVRGEPYSIKSYLVLFTAFLPVAMGASIFGILNSRPMLLLGSISYDVYILHGLVLFVLFHLVSPIFFVGLSTGMFVLTLMVVGTIVIALSIAVHRFVELPAMMASSHAQRVDPRERLAAP